MKRLLFLFLLTLLSVSAQIFPTAAYTPVTASSNGTIHTPTTLWTANAAGIASALSLASTYQPLSANLTSWSAIAPANKLGVTEYKTAAFTAESGHAYNANGTLTVSNPASAVAGDWFNVFVQAGTVTVNGVVRVVGELVLMNYVSGAWTATVLSGAGGPPAAHAASHAVGGTDPLSPESIGAPSIPSGIKTADYTAHSGETVLVDTSGGPITLTLPSPVIGAVVTLKDVGGNAATNNITVNRSNGMTLRVVNISGTTTTWHCRATTTNGGGGTWARSQFDLTNDAIGTAPDSQMLAGYTTATLPISTATTTAIGVETSRATAAELTKLPRTSRVPRRVVLFGDSITALNGGPQLDGSSTYYSAQGFWNWANVQMGFRYEFVVNAGVSGNKVAQMDARFATDVAAYTPNVVVVFAGINDVVTISSNGADTSTVIAATKASLASIYDKVYALGAICVVSPMTPMSEAAGTVHVLTANEKIAWATINQWIREQAKSRPLMVLADMSAAITDKTLNARPINDTVPPGTHPALLHDGLHPAASGAMLMGRALADAMSPLAPPANPYLVGVNSVNYLTNAAMTGATGATGPTGWNATDIGGGGVMAFSYVARTDGVSGNWLKVDLTGSTNTSPTIKFFQGATYSGATGDKVKFVVEFQCEDQSYANGIDIRNIALYVIGSGATVLTGCFADGSFTSGGTARVCSSTLFHPASGVLESPPVIWTSTTTSLVPTLFMTGKTIWRIGRVSCVKVP